MAALTTFWPLRKHGEDLILWSVLKHSNLREAKLFSEVEDFDPGRNWGLAGCLHVH